MTQAFGMVVAGGTQAQVYVTMEGIHGFTTDVW